MGNHRDHHEKGVGHVVTNHRDKEDGRAWGAC